ncbi:MAG: hypothetical protein QNJ07_16630 [Woeseiaceae bacterium]|nr:hypothetical protein [Woeseiaceae bacterium]
MPPPAPPPPPPSPDPTSITLSSDAGDFIGQGNTYTYSQANALITVTVTDANLEMRVEGDESWTGNFVLPNTMSTLQVGTYTNLTRYPFHDAAVGGLDWSGEGRGCNILSGSITIESVIYNGSVLEEIDFTFEQFCENGSAALRGDIRWDASDPTEPPGPTASLPAGLWAPAAGVVPDTGSFIYLESQPGDYIGAGANYLYTLETAVVTAMANDGRLSVSVSGNEIWNGDFQAMSSVSQLDAGYYGELQRYPFHNPVKGGLNWSGEGRGCNRLEGWFVVDSVTYDGAALETIELRFEQHCEGNGPALNGAIRWDANEMTAAPGPVMPPPGLWEPTPSVVPDTGNYVYLESDFDDWVGQGRNYLYTAFDSLITVDSDAARLSVSVDGDERWGGDFQGMNSISRIEVGYYGDLRRFPFHNPVKGGLSWSGEGRGCNTLEGWFVVDSVTYDGSNLLAVELRFEQHCEGGSAALNGAIRWDANDTTEPPGPVVPVPDGLWEPPAAVVPQTANYFYFEGRRNYLYTQADSTLIVEAPGRRLNATVYGDEDWIGNFEAMSSVGQLEVGYYANLQEFPFHNPAFGGLSWSGPDSNCSDDAWLAIDSLVFDGADLASIEFRFEQTCGLETLRGAVRWDVNDPTTPPGPVNPPPAGLWEPPPGVTPATGDFVYLQSDTGDYIGGGRNYLYTPQDTQFIVDAPGGRMEIRVVGTEDWRGSFQAMNTLNFLETGYYGDLQRYGVHNAAKGGLRWIGGGRACSMLSGWFVIDSVTYDGISLTAIELRFEQHCEGRIPALRGEIHWTR